MCWSILETYPNISTGSSPRVGTSGYVCHKEIHPKMWLYKLFQNLRSLSLKWDTLENVFLNRVWEKAMLLAFLFRHRAGGHLARWSETKTLSLFSGSKTQYISFVFPPKQTQKGCTSILNNHSSFRRLDTCRTASADLFKWTAIEHLRSSHICEWTETQWWNASIVDEAPLASPITSRQNICVW